MGHPNRGLLQRYFDDLLVKGDRNALDEIYAEDVTYHTPETTLEGSEALWQFVLLYREAFPDIDFEVQAMAAEDDVVSALWVTTGTHDGPLPNLPPTGKYVRSQGSTTARVENGRIVEQWSLWDQLDFLQQLGIMEAS